MQKKVSLDHLERNGSGLYRTFFCSFHSVERRIALVILVHRWGAYQNASKRIGENKNQKYMIVIGSSLKGWIIVFR